MKALIFYKPETLQIVGMTDGEVSFESFPHIEHEFESYPHATDNFELVNDNGTIKLVIHEIKPEGVE